MLEFETMLKTEATIQKEDTFNELFNLLEESGGKSDFFQEQLDQELIEENKKNWPEWKLRASKVNYEEHKKLKDKICKKFEYAGKACK